MTWTTDQKILNRARAISRNLNNIRWILGLLTGDNAHGDPKPRKLTPRELNRLQGLNEQLLWQGMKLKKLLDLAEGKR